jgi:putative addiction module CopG family antidote
MSIQLVARIPDDLAKQLDELVEQGSFTSRSDVVRAGLEALLEQRRREAIGRAIVEGYRRTPEGDDDSGWPDEATAAMIAEEPW